MRFVSPVMMAALVGIAHAEVQLTWVSWTDNGEAVISYQASQTDNVLFTITCHMADGTGVLIPGGNAQGIMAGENIRVTISAPGGSNSYRGVAQVNEMNGNVNTSIALPVAIEALGPLSKAGVLTIQYPSNSYSIPVGPRAEEALKSFRSRCPSIK